MIDICNEMWLESNVVRKFGVFLGQCFADPFSRTPIVSKENPNAILARQALEIDIMQA
jgi:hypothetical protein